MLTRPLRILLGFSFLLLTFASSHTAQVSVCPGGGWTAGTTHAAGTGADRLLVVTVGAESNTQGANDIASVTYGGQTLTLAEKLESPDAGFSYLGSLWYLKESALAAASDSTIVVNVTGAFAEFSVAAVTYCNVDQTTPIGSINSATSLVDPITVSIVVDAGSAGVAAVGCGNAFEFAWTQDVTERLDINQGSSTWSTADQVNYATAGTKTAQADFLNLVNRVVLIFAEIHEVPQAPGPPIAQFSGSPISGAAPLTVNFSDQSSGSISSHSWTFGDGGGSGLVNPAHTYNAAGTYNVTLNVTGPGGSDGETKLAYITVDPPAPVAQFIGTPTSGAAPLTVNFSDQSSGVISSHSWTFGDGGGSGLASPAHTYNAAGTYNVTLSVTGPGGSDGETKLAYITVDPPGPVAQFSGSPTSGVAPLIVGFTDLSTGIISSHSWNFGDGGGSSQSDPGHTYTNPGTYTVVLTVTGPGGSDVESKPGFVTVDPAAVAAYRNGSGENAPCYTSTPPVLGGTWMAGVDSSAFDAAVVSAILVRPIGIPGTNTAFGELLIDTTSAVVVNSFTVATGGVDAHTFNLPNDVSLLGNVGTSQAILLSANNTGRFCNAVDLTIGFTPNFARPIAAFTSTNTIAPAPLLVNFTDLSTGTITSRTWNFGDGNGSSAQHPAHDYTVPGIYEVSLVVEGPGGFDAVFEKDLVIAGFTASATYRNGSGVNPPCYIADPPIPGMNWIATIDHRDRPGASFAFVLIWSQVNPGVDVMGLGELLVGGIQFFQFVSAADASGITTLNFNIPNDPSIMGVGTSQGLIAGTPAAQTLCNAADMRLGFAPVQAQPAADFIGGPGMGSAPHTISATDMSTGIVTSWIWDFGDGGTSTLQNPTHIYNQPGTYSISLVASGPGGFDIERKFDIVVVQ